MNKHPFDQQRRNLERALKNLPRQVGVVIVRETKGNFKRGGFFGDKWKPRSNDSPRNSGRGVLVDSGVLRRSIRAEVRRSTITVLSDVPYASIHNNGGTIHQKVTKKQRKFFFAKHKETGRENFKRAALAERLTIKIPKRQFLGAHPTLKKKINAFVERRFNKALKVS